MARKGEKNFSAAVKITEQIFPGGLFDGEAPESAALAREVLIKCEKGKKTVLIDGKRVEDRKELISVAPCIVFCHEDMEFVSGSPERRRWFFDQSLSLYDPVYLDDLRRFRRVLKSRNSLLRENSLRRFQGSIGEVLDALDSQMIEYGLKLMEKRESAAVLFSRIFGPLYREVAGIDKIAVQYSPSWKSPDPADALRERRPADLAAGISLCGPHRDRYLFAQDGLEFSTSASTGQRRLLALLLRLAQARRYSDMTGKKPALLLDDVLLEMDGEKRKRFISVLPDYDQAFYTFLPEEPFQHYRKSDTIVYRVNGGAVT